MSFLSELLEGFAQVFLLGGFLVIIVLGYNYYVDRLEDYRKAAYSKTQKFVILRIFPPTQNINSMHRMEDFFNSVWSIYRERTPFKLFTLGRSYESMFIEIHSKGGYVGFFIRVNKTNQEVITSQLFEKFPGIKVVESPDPLQDFPKEWNRKGQYTQMYATDMKTMEITTGKESDLFPLRSWREFQTDNKMPVSDPAAQLFGILQAIDPRTYVILQYIVRPLHNKGKLKEWKIEYQSRKKEFLDEVDLNLTKRQKIMTSTKTQTSILNGITRKIHSLNYLCKIRAVALAEPGVEVGTLQNLIASYFVQFDSEKAKIAPQHQTETAFGAGGAYLGILGPQIDVFFDKTVFERERYFREKMVYDGMRRRNIDVGSKTYYLDPQSLAAMIHFPYITPETAQQRAMKADVASEETGSSKYQHIFKTQPPEGLPT